MESPPLACAFNCTGSSQVVWSGPASTVGSGITVTAITVSWGAAEIVRHREGRVSITRASGSCSIELQSGPVLTVPWS